MTRRIVPIIGLLLVAILTTVVLVLVQPVASKPPFTSPDAQAIEAVIKRSVIVDLEAEYTLDPSELSTVYANDPRGVLTEGALNQIREIRQDPTIQGRDVGYLDYQVALIEMRRASWEIFVADLRAKQAAGTLSGTEKAQLGRIDGVPTEQPAPTEVAPAASAASPTPPPPAEQPPPRPYPVPTEFPDRLGYPADSTQTPPEDQAPLRSPTAEPTRDADEVGLPFRYPDPSTMPPEALDITVVSVRVIGDRAYAVVSYRAGSSEMALLKVDGNWYIVGGRLLKLEV